MRDAKNTKPQDPPETVVEADEIFSPEGASIASRDDRADYEHEEYTYSQRTTTTTNSGCAIGTGGCLALLVLIAMLVFATPFLLIFLPFILVGLLLGGMSKK